MAEGGYLKGDGNWVTPGNWSNSAIPILDSDAIIPASLANDTTDPSSAADGIDLDLLYVHRGYTHSFGTTGSPIKTAMDVGKFYSSGPCYFECDNNALSVKTDYLTIALAQANIPCEIGSVTGRAGEIDFIRCLRGLITLKGGINFGTGWVQVGHVRNRASDAKVTIEATAETLPLLQVFGGECISKNVLTTVYVAGGTLIKQTAALTTCYIGPGGIVRYEHENADTTPQFHVLSGGTLDLLTESAVPKTLGNVRLYPGSTILYDPDLHTITLEDMRDGVL